MHFLRRRSSHTVVLGTMLIAFGAASGWAVQTGATRAEASEVQIQSLRMGLDGKYKVGHWTPVWITINGGAKDTQGVLEAVALDGDGNPAAFSQGDSDPVAIPAGSEVTVERYVKLGRTGGNLTIRLTTDDGVVASRRFKGNQLPPSVRSIQPLIVTLGPSIGVAEAVKGRLRDRANPIVTARMEDLTELPRQWYGYESVDMIIVATSQVCTLEQMDDTQFAAFDQWMKLGGRLILCVGKRGEEVSPTAHAWLVTAPATSRQ